MPVVRLTDRFVKSAKPRAGEKRTDYFDDVTKGFILRVSESEASWSFFFINPVDGLRARLKLGTYPATTLAAARARAVEAGGIVEEGLDPRVVFAGESAKAFTVATLWDSYREKHVRPNLRSAGGYEGRMRLNVLPMIGSVKLDALKARDINAVLDPIIERKSPNEANAVFDSMRAMFRWAVRRGDMDRSPMDTMAKPAEKGAPRERVLSSDEIRHMWIRLPRALSRTILCQRIVRLCLVTAQRVGEVSRMRRPELDLKRRLWSLPGERTKNASPHAVPLSDMAMKIIEAALEDAGDSEFVFPSPFAFDHDGRAKDGLCPEAVSMTLRRAHAATKAMPNGRSIWHPSAPTTFAGRL